MGDERSSFFFLWVLDRKLNWKVLNRQHCKSGPQWGYGGIGWKRRKGGAGKQMMESKNRTGRRKGLEYELVG